MSLVPLAGLLTGSLLTLGIAVLVIVVIAVRRKRHCDGANHCPHHIALDASKPASKSRQGSMLEINTGDNRYVVAYTLKPAADCSPQFEAGDNSRRQPDILNAPRGECACKCHGNVGRCRSHPRHFTTFQHFDDV